MLRHSLACVICVALLTACSPEPTSLPASVAASNTPTRPVVRLLFGGDVMLGRGVAPIAREDPDSIFSGLQAALARADLAAANLESPLTRRPHVVANPNALEAPPHSARILAAAGFDAMSVANNHAGDAGPDTLRDTTSALEVAGIAAVGADARPVLLHRRGLTIAILAFDASARDGPTAQVARWDPAAARAAVRGAAATADLVTVSLHGGMDYKPVTDPWLSAAGTRLARWGADVVWCHGPHVAQPVMRVDPDADGRPTIVATSLGNLLFDHQGIPGTDQGALLEVRADADGVIAYRVATTEIDTGRVFVAGWPAPEGDAVAYDGGWWAAAGSIPRAAPALVPPRLPVLPGTWTVIDAAFGDVDGDGTPEVALALRRPYEPSLQMRTMPHHRWTDAEGRIAGVAVYRGDDLRPAWVSSSVLRPVSALVPCGRALVVAYSTLDEAATVATGLWPWRGFGFTSSADLPGAGSPGCVDVDLDGIVDPVVTGRSTS